jgi:hypothetical protein
MQLFLISDQCHLRHPQSSKRHLSPHKAQPYAVLVYRTLCVSPRAEQTQSCSATPRKMICIPPCPRLLVSTDLCQSLPALPLFHAAQLTVGREAPLDQVHRHPASPSEASPTNTFHPFTRMARRICIVRRHHPRYPRQYTIPTVELSVRELRKPVRRLTDTSSTLWAPCVWRLS